MWVKILNNGGMISEDRSIGSTWLKTSSDVYACYLVIDGKRSPILRGCKEYWHARSAYITTGGQRKDVAEHIQGLLENGKWLTITWSNGNFQTTIRDNPIGRGF